MFDLAQFTLSYFIYTFVVLFADIVSTLESSLIHGLKVLSLSDAS